MIDSELRLPQRDGRQIGCDELNVLTEERAQSQDSVGSGLIIVSILIAFTRSSWPLPAAPTTDRVNRPYRALATRRAARSSPHCRTAGRSTKVVNRFDPMQMRVSTPSEFRPRWPALTRLK